MDKFYLFFTLLAALLGAAPAAAVAQDRGATTSNNTSTTNVCDQLRHTRDGEPGVDAVLRACEADALRTGARDDLAYVAERRVARGECGEAERLAETATRDEAGASLPRCVAAMARLCNITRAAERSATADAVDCAPAGAHAQVVDLVLYCTSAADGYRVAALRQVLGAAYVCRDDGVFSGAAAGLANRREPALETVRDHAPPGGLSDALLLERAGQEAEEVEREMAAMRAAEAAGTAVTPAPARPQRYVVHRRLRRFLERSFERGAPADTALVEQGANALVRIAGALTHESSANLGLPLADLTFLRAHGLLTPARVQHTLAWPLWGHLRGAELGATERGMVQAVADDVCALREPAGQLACMRLRTALAVNGPTPEPCDAATGLYRAWVDFRGNPASATIPAREHAADRAVIGRQGLQLARRCSVGAEPMVRLFEELRRAEDGGAEVGGAVGRQVDFDGGELVRPPALAPARQQRATPTRSGRTRRTMATSERRNP